MPCRRLGALVLVLVAACAADDGIESAAFAIKGQTATFTVGARTVTFRGPMRTFTESKNGITSTVRTDAWVRVLDAPFDGKVDRAWLAAAAAENAAGTPDLLQMATEYFDGAPPILDGAFRPLAGDAGYGAD